LAKEWIKQLNTTALNRDGVLSINWGVAWIVKRSVQLSMSRSELRAWLGQLLPYVKGKTQTVALFAVLLIVGAGNPFDAPHIHVEPAPIVPTVSAPSMYVNATPGVMSFSSRNARWHADFPCGWDIRNKK
jgi:hypothetical protein